MNEELLSSSRYHRYPAQVVGCLKSGEITVALCSGVGLAHGGSNVALSSNLVPVDLRMPNSEFDVLFDKVLCSFIRILRKGEPLTEDV